MRENDDHQSGFLEAPLVRVKPGTDGELKKGLLKDHVLHMYLISQD
jgi:hypothetical protein